MVSIYCKTVVGLAIQHPKGAHKIADLLQINYFSTDATKDEFVRQGTVNFFST